MADRYIRGRPLKLELQPPRTNNRWGRDGDNTLTKVSRDLLQIDALRQDTGVSRQPV